MCADILRIALVLPNIDVFSGGVERTVHLIEHSRAAGIEYTAYYPSGGIPNGEVRRRLEGLQADGLLELRGPGAANGGSGAIPGGHDAVAVPTEYWWQGWRRARSLGLHGPFCFDFHQLPYIGTLDILKSVDVDNPGLPDLARLPFLLRRIYSDGIFLTAFQTTASIASVRSLGRLREGRVLAVTPVVAKNLASVGYRGPLFVPRCPNGVERGPVEAALDQDIDVEYDGVYVGRFHPHKGILDLPYVVAGMKRILGRELRVAVCGRPHFPRHLARFRTLVKSLGVEENLVILGRLARADLYRTVRASQMLLYPSYVDGFSLTVLESLCLGVPVVAYDIDALKMIWSTRKGIFRTRVGDRDALATGAARLHDDGLEEARASARAQSAGLLDFFDWDRVAQDERRFYEAACEGLPAAG